ncbi:hypothetical protein F4009_15240 [Candidatus Poribacteria bacterium]|nr:hypothetical protein [Candidatus Poribacteria bacterium]MYH83149.1 hypothetical protein [Candidatus Poribacteria bacterium]MYK95325.1 hypothetical protein [Candidatus Poribacteria bacterium]
MRRYLFLIVMLAVFVAVTLVHDARSAEEIRVWGGKVEDFKDSKGRVWHGGQNEKEAWGGWVEKLPRVAEVQNLTKDAEKLAKAEGYDKELFYAVSWAQFPDVVKMELKTGKGMFDVTYLVGEHWSPNNRGFDIIIEDEIVELEYVTPGKDEIDIKRYPGIEVKDQVMNLEFAGNRDTGAGDLNAMFSGIEVIPALAVDPQQKVTTTWGALKSERQNP